MAADYSTDTVLMCWWHFLITLFTTIPGEPEPQVDCPVLPDIANGRIAYTGTSDSRTAEYTCNSGYTLCGNAERQCDAAREWSGEDPVCRLDPLGKIYNYVDSITAQYTVSRNTPTQSAVADKDLHFYVILLPKFFSTSTLQLW